MLRILTDLGCDNRTVQLWMRLQALRRGCHLKCGPYTWDLTKGSQMIRISRRQFASVGQLAANFDYMFEALEAKTSSGHPILDFSRMQLHKFRESGAMFEFAEWPEPDAAFNLYLEDDQRTSNDLIFDLGAECGVSTHVFSQIAGSVIAFEPELGFREILQRNVARQGLANVTVTQSVKSFANLIETYGEPRFCRVNLDRLKPNFVMENSEILKSINTMFAARSKYWRVRSQFMRALKRAGFKSTSNRSLGLVWARPLDTWNDDS